MARVKVKAHLKTNLKSMISWELKQANKRVQNSALGTRRHDVKPLHINLDAWEALCDWWDSEKFQRMSKKNKENRKRKMLLHTTDAKPYVIFRQASLLFKFFFVTVIICMSTFNIKIIMNTLGGRVKRITENA